MLNFKEFAFCLWLLGSLFSICLALKLNLTEACAEQLEKQQHFCTISNLTSDLDNPLVVSLGAVVELHELVLRNSKLGRVPRDIFWQTPNLKVLFLHKCDLNRLNPNDFEQTKKLERLFVQRNRFFDMPEKMFTNLLYLRELNLAANTIHIVHVTAFDGLTQLRYLDLQHNNIRSLTGILDELTSLQHLDVSINELEKIDAETFAHNLLLRVLILSGNKFTVFEPNSLQHLPHLNLLDLSYSRLDDLALASVDTLLVQDSDLSSLSINGSITKLFADNNKLKSISITDLLSVRELVLRGNSFKNLTSFEGMLNLQHLDISKNRLRSLYTREDTRYIILPSLTYLILASNQLEEVTFENFMLLQKLEYLDLAFNRLKTLDASILDPLDNLQYLYVESNQLSNFDYEQLILAHTYLKEMGLFENDWEIRYLRRMVSYFRDNDVDLPVRFASSNDIPSLEPMKTALLASTRQLTGGYKETTMQVEPEGTETEPEQFGVTGIHPYWTAHDIYTMVVLVIVAVILILQIYTILREDGCLPMRWCCARGETTTADLQNRPRRLHESDSEV